MLVIDAISGPSTWQMSAAKCGLIVTTVLLLAACTEKAALLTCPDGARIVGAAPPQGYNQRCERPGGIRHGLSRFWHANGQLSAETEWSNGRKHGTFRLWYPNGRKRAEGAHYDMQPVGSWSFWDGQGNLFQKEEFGDKKI